jgi:hypothetical protein
MVCIFLFSAFAGMASAMISSEIRANMEAYYTHENPDAVEGPTTGRASSRDPVKTWDIDVSFEWEADAGDFSQWQTEFINANKKLYDGTDGQMAFRRIDMYNDMEHWSTADVHLNNQNGRAYTYRGGIQWSNLHIELFKNDVGMGGKVIQHEWGHYGLFLPDEYTDSHGPFCRCTMGTTYDTNEWCCESNHCDYDPSYCSSHGEADSCWKQMATYYPVLTEKDPPVAGPYDPPAPEIIWHFPDLSTDNDEMTISPAEPKAGEDVQIKVDIYNKESLVGRNVDVAFYDGSAISANLLATKSVPIYSTWTTATFIWTALPGEHTITAVIDPNDIINEITKSNNTAQKSVVVNAPPEISTSLVKLSTKEDTDLEVDLSKYESDVEDGDDSPDLDWTVTQYDNKVIKQIGGEESDDDVLTFKVDPDWSGTTEVELTLTDSVGLTASKDVDLVWDEINDLPVVDDIGLDQAMVYRMGTVSMYMTGSDIEDELEGLEPELEYQHGDADIWTPVTLELKEDRFEATLYTDEFFPVGFYNLRARLTDTDQLSSEYYYENSTLEIRNNLPQVLGMDLEDDVVLRGEELVISLTASDIETPQDFLEPYLDISLCGDEDWTSVEIESQFMDDYWELLYTPDLELEEGDYCFMGYVEDDLGDRSKYHISDEFSILNNPPVVSEIALIEDTVLRTQTITISIYGSDVEDDKESLSAEVNYKLDPGNWEAAYISDIRYESANDAWAARFTPPKNARTGMYLLSARLIDTEDGKGEWFEPADIIIEVQNNDPVAEMAPLKTMTAGKSGTFDASGSTDLEDTGLTYSWDFGDKKTGKGVKTTHTYAKAGKFKVTLTVTDSDGGANTISEEVTVKEASIFGEDGGGSSGLSAAAIGGIGLLVVIVVIILLVLVMRARSNASEEPPEPVPEENGGPSLMNEPLEKIPSEDPVPPPGPPTNVEYQVESYKMYDEPEEGPQAYGEPTKEKYYK